MDFSSVNYQADTLILNAHGKLSDNLAVQFDRLMKDARLAEDDIRSPWSFQGQPLYVKGHGGGRPWKHIAYSDDLHLDIGTGKFNGIICKARFSSLLLHEHGLEKALHLVHEFLLDLFCTSLGLQVSEIHLCADIAGWELTKADEDCFIGRASIRDIPEDEVLRIPQMQRSRGRKIRTMYFSQTAPHSCVIYDKSNEVKLHGKQWFYEVWKRHGWDGKTRIFRVEFRYERSCLHEMGIEDPYEMIPRIPEMWAYSTKKWLRHTEPQADENQSRWPTSEVWQVVQAASGDLSATPAIRTKKIELDAERTKVGTFGYLTSWAARAVGLWERMAPEEREQLRNVALPLQVVDEDGGGFLEWMYGVMQAYLKENKGATFEQVMRAKADKLGLKLGEKGA